MTFRDSTATLPAPAMLRRGDFTATVESGPGNFLYVTGVLSNSSASTRGNLRPEPSRFVGRDDDLAALHDLVERHGLVSIAGPAGLGKTRLALRYAALHENDFPSVWFFDLRRA